MQTDRLDFDSFRKGMMSKLPLVSSSSSELDYSTGTEVYLYWEIAWQWNGEDWPLVSYTKAKKLIYLTLQCWTELI